MPSRIAKRAIMRDATFQRGCRRPGSLCLCIVNLRGIYKSNPISWVTFDNGG